MKTIFFTGKGGVGKSTLSAAGAHQLAGKGHKVLAISFDPAHNLGDIFGLTLTHEKKKFSDNLHLQEADFDEAAQEYIGQNTDILTEVYGYTKAFNLDRYFKVLRHSPGVEEYAALAVLEKVLRTSDEFDVVVVDTPPTGLTLRIMALPRITIAWIDRLVRIRRDILDKRHTIHNISGRFIAAGAKLVYDEKDDRVMQTLQALFDRYLKVARHLESDESQTAVVFNPDYLSLRESQRIFSGLDDLDIGVDVALNNKYTPSLEEIADEMEGELFGRMNDPPVCARIPLRAHRREKSYEIDYDLTQLFRGF